MIKFLLRVRLAYFLLAVGLISSCLTPIEFEAGNQGGRLVVSGQVSTLPDRSTVQLGKTAENKRLPLPVSGALIKLVDGGGGVSYFAEDIAKPGFYNLVGGQGVPGQDYYLEITLPDGDVYESTSEKIPESVGSLSTFYKIENEEYTNSGGGVTSQVFMKFYGNINLPESIPATYLRWSIEEAYLLSPTDFPDPFGSIPPPCFITQSVDPQRVVLFNGFEFPTRAIESQLIGSRLVDFSFLEKHAFTIHQTALTVEAYEYWRKVNILANQVGSIFDSPPAELSGNIRGGTGGAGLPLGYFQAVNEVYDRFFVYPYEFPFPLTFEPCTFDGSFRASDYPPRCINCLTVRHSSYTRPPWF